MTKTDRETIQERMATYLDAIDEKDYDRLVACFTPDATAQYGGHSALLSGHGEIIAHMRRMLEPLDGTHHFMTNFIIDIAGNDARLTSSVLGQHWLNGAGDGEVCSGGGKYRVELSKDDGNWRIVRLVARSLWQDGNGRLVPKATEPALERKGS